MSKKIIVAGAGHGGIAVAALLSKAGYYVTVCERLGEGKLGHDWTDIFSPRAWAAAGMDMPPADTYEIKEDMTFYSPNLKIPIRQHIPEDELEIKMERRDIYNHLINHANRNKVKFEYNCEVIGPIMAGNRVIGIKTQKGDFFADLIIDAAGLNSPIRAKLPPTCQIESMPAKFELLYAYRAFFDKPQGIKEDAKYKVFLLPRGEKGVAWVATEGQYSDLLIGKFEPFGEEEVESLADYLREANPWLGKKLLRGGQFVQIPIRQPLAVMVCDGYAAIGDSAFMTIPIIGSGIANSFKAAGFLAQTILEDEAGAYSADSLWPYQTRYYKEVGAGLSQIACLKNMLFNVDPQELDYCFEEGVLTARDLALGSDSISLTALFKMTPAEAKHRFLALKNKQALFKKVLALAANIAKATLITGQMPKRRESFKVAKWSNKYRKFYSDLLREIDV